MKEPLTIEQAEALVADVGQKITAHLDAIQTLFQPGVRLTLVIRNPEQPERSAVMTSEDDDVDPEVVCKALRHMNGRTGGSVIDFVSGRPGVKRTKQ